MQGIFSVPECWRDPLPSLKRSFTLTLAILLVESSVYLLKDAFLPFPQIYLLAGLRATDTLILLAWGPWSLKRHDITETGKEALLAALCLSVAGMVLLASWKGVSGSPLFRIDERFFQQKGSLLIIFYVTSCLLSPIAEELVFRGILYRNLRERWNVWVSSGVTSLVFALVHLYFGNHALFPFLGSLIFCLGYEKTRSVLTPILLHTSGNLLIYLSPLIPFT